MVHGARLSHCDYSTACKEVTDSKPYVGHRHCPVLRSMTTSPGVWDEHCEKGQQCLGSGGPGGSSVYTDWKTNTQEMLQLPSTSPVGWACLKHIPCCLHKGEGQDHWGVCVCACSHECALRDMRLTHVCPQLPRVQLSPHTFWKASLTTWQKCCPLWTSPCCLCASHLGHPAASEASWGPLCWAAGPDEGRRKATLGFPLNYASHIIRI
jgi:hypothetical protein